MNSLESLTFMGVLRTTNVSVPWAFARLKVVQFSSFASVAHLVHLVPPHKLVLPPVVYLTSMY